MLSMPRALTAKPRSGEQRRCLVGDLPEGDVAHLGHESVDQRAVSAAGRERIGEHERGTPDHAIGEKAVRVPEMLQVRLVRHRIGESEPAVPPQERLPVEVR